MDRLQFYRFLSENTSVTKAGCQHREGGGDLILILDSLDTRKIIYPGDAPWLDLARPDTGRSAVSGATARLARQGAGSSWLMWEYWPLLVTDSNISNVRILPPAGGDSSIAAPVTPSHTHPANTGDTCTGHMLKGIHALCSVDTGNIGTVETPM